MVFTPCPRLQGMGLPQSGQKLSGIQLAMLRLARTLGGASGLVFQDVPKKSSATKRESGVLEGCQEPGSL